MKKIMVFVLFAALAATGLFAQSKVNHGSPWESLNPGLIGRPQTKISGSPYVDVKTGVPVSDIVGFKMSFFIPVKYQDEATLPGYVRYISDKNPSFQVQIKDAKKNLKLIDIQPVSVTSFKDATSGKDYLRVIIIVPTNYIGLYFYFDADFQPLVVGEDLPETKRLVGQFTYVESDFCQPSVTTTTASKLAENKTEKLVPANSSPVKPVNMGGGLEATR